MYIVAGTLKNRRFKTPKGSQTRPTMGMVREALFNICQHRIEGALFLDLFAGSGAMGIEALSRGAAQAVFIDASRDSIRCIMENVQNLGIGDRAQILQGDVFEKMQLLEKLKKRFDIIYVDPPYDAEDFKRVLVTIDEGSLLSSGGLLFIEGPHPFDLSEVELKQLTFERARRMGRTTLLQYGLVK